MYVSLDSPTYKVHLDAASLLYSSQNTSNARSAYWQGLGIFPSPPHLSSSLLLLLDKFCWKIMGVYTHYTQDQLHLPRSKALGNWVWGEGAVDYFAFNPLACHYFYFSLKQRNLIVKTFSPHPGSQDVSHPNLD